MFNKWNKIHDLISMTVIECINNSVVFVKDVEEKVLNRLMVWTVESLMLHFEILGSGVEKLSGQI